MKGWPLVGKRESTPQTAVPVSLYDPCLFSGTCSLRRTLLITCLGGRKASISIQERRQQNVNVRSHFAHTDSRESAREARCRPERTEGCAIVLPVRNVVRLDGLCQVGVSVVERSF